MQSEGGRGRERGSHESGCNPTQVSLGFYSSIGTEQLPMLWRFHLPTERLEHAIFYTIWQEQSPCVKIGGEYQNCPYNALDPSLVRRFNFGGLTTPARFFFPLEIRCKEFYNFPTVPGNIDLPASSPWEYCPANKRPSRRGHGATFVFSWSLARRVRSSRSEKRARRRRLSYSHRHFSTPF